MIPWECSFASFESAGLRFTRNGANAPGHTTSSIITSTDDDFDEKSRASCAYESVEAAGSRGIAVAADVTQRADVAALVDAAVAEFGRIDGMCNIAGAMFPGLIEDLDDDTIDRGIALNLKGVLYGTQYAIRAMKARGGGAIVNVSSTGIDAPHAGIGVYALTKAAVAMLTMTAAVEAGEHNIRVNSINPGMVETEGVHAAGFAASDFRKEIEAQTPLGRIGQPHDIAPAAVFLASSDSSWITGETLVIAGGLH